MRPVYVPQPAYAAPVPEELPWQEVRYLRVSNQSGVDLTVYVRTSDGVTWRWNIAADALTYLAIDGERLTAREVFLWAGAGGRSWNQYREQPLVLVPTAYQSAGIATFTFTFNP